MKQPTTQPANAPPGPAQPGVNPAQAGVNIDPYNNPLPSQANHGRLSGSKRHWSPAYMVDRVRWEIWQKRHATEPWLVPAAVHFLQNWLKPTDVMVEFGSGRSTRWFAERIARVYSVEHYKEWCETVQGQLRDAGLNNATLLHSGDTPETYLAIVSDALKAPADIILIDGIHRGPCAVWALDRIAPGGLIVIDNANWYLPSSSRAPSSIPVTGRPAGPELELFTEKVSSWRRVWFSSGVTDTVVLFAP